MVTVLNHVGALGREAIEAAGHAGVEVVDLPMGGPVPSGLRGDVLLTSTSYVEDLGDLLASTGVQWVHEFGTGVDRAPLDVIFEGGRTFTCSRGASAVPISEWVMAQILASAKRLPGSWISEPPPSWSLGEPLGLLAGAALGIVGLGGIGARVARLGRTFEMDVSALRRSSRPSPVAGVRVVQELGELLGAVDHLVLAAPATAATERLIDADALGAIRPGLHLINVARGSLVDQEALRSALDDGRVARASLDVCTPEPLPEGHWLYSHPRVFLSPHISWSNPGGVPRSLEGFVANLGRFLAGEALMDVVDPIQRY